MLRAQQTCFIDCTACCHMPRQTLKRHLIACSVTWLNLDRGAWGPMHATFLWSTNRTSFVTTAALYVCACACACVRARACVCASQSCQTQPAVNLSSGPKATCTATPIRRRVWRFCRFAILSFGYFECGWSRSGCVHILVRALVCHSFVGVCWS